VRLEVTNLEIAHAGMPAIRVGDRAARVAFASPREVGVVVPSDLEGGRFPVRLEEAPGSTVFVEVGRTLATGLHMVDSPVIGRDEAVYVTYSGARGQQSTVSIYRVQPNGVREVFVTGVTNATSMAFDPEGRLHVSSRFDGTVLRIDSDGEAEVVASDLGVATGLAFTNEGVLYVGDRSGTIFRLRAGTPVPFASLPPSVAAYHLAASPDGGLYATAPTLATRDAVYRIDRHGAVTTVYEGFGRPQGLTVDADGALYVTEALAGASGVYRLRPGQGPPELLIAGIGLIGVALHPRGGFVVSTSETVYRFESSPF
jgi:sugar lactone lactonase YvrE